MLKTYPQMFIITFIVSLALFMDSLDSTILNTAIPAISKSLNVHPIDLKIALITYLLSLAIFIPISGWIADRFGIKRAFIFALGVFTVSSLWCGNVNSLNELIIARSFQGLGGALMLPLGRLIILRSFPKHEVVNAMSHVIMVVAFGVMLGPFIGGFITDRFSWPWIFWVNIPVGLIAMCLAGYFLVDNAERKAIPLDFVGFVLFGTALAGIIFSLADLSESKANHSLSLMMMAISLALLTLYFLHARHVLHPIVNTRLFKFRTFQVAATGNLCARLGFGGVPFLLPLLLQLGLGYSAETSGLLIAPIALGILLVKGLSLRILRLFGFKRLLIFNTLLVGLGLWAFQIINIQTSMAVIVCLTFLFGFLVSVQYSGMNALAYADIPPEDLSGATSIMSTIQQLAQSLGVAVSALLLRFFSATTHSGFQLTTHIFHLTFLAMGILTWCSTLIFVRLKSLDGQQMLYNAETIRSENGR